MGIIRNTLQKQIQDYDRITFNGTTATILEYDKTTETCKIKFPNPNGDGYIYRGNVPIAGSTGGVATNGYSAGQQCSITFVNGNVFSPVITGVDNSRYIDRTNTDQGAYIASDEVYKVGTQEHLIATSTNWIDDSNTDLTKYQNELGMYQDTEADQQAMELVATLDKYQDNEVGMTNLKNKSSVRLRDNGDIDVFTENNTGIRICKSGNIKLYGKDIEFTNSKTDDKTDKSLTKQITVGQIMKICLAYDIIKETDNYVSNIESGISDSTKLNGDQS